MGIVHLAFDGLAWIGSFVIVHLYLSFLLRDRTNIDYGASIAVVLLPSFLLYYGIPPEGVSFTVRVVAVISVAVLLAWGLATLFTCLTWWEDLSIGIVAVGAYLLLYAGARWLWSVTLLT